MIPLPCNPDQISIGYGLRQGGEVTPLTRLLPRDLILNGPNTISYEAYPELKAKILDLLLLATAQAILMERVVQALLEAGYTTILSGGGPAEGRRTTHG